MTIDKKDPRFDLHQLLLSYQPLDALDEGRCTYICEFVDKNPNCFDRKNADGHVTGSAWVVNSTGDRVLLNHHKKLGKWLQVGGHADGNSDLMAVALREAQEESGLTTLKPLSKAIFDVDVHAIPEHDSEPMHYHYDIRFLFQCEGNEPIKVSKESHAVSWVTLDNLGTYSQEESLFRMATKWENFLKDRKAAPH